jgi:DNA-binding transcriptional ArsR family regulator
LNEAKDVEKRIFELLRRQPMSVSELARLLELRRDFVSGYLEALRSKDKLELIKVGRSNVYVPKEGSK